MDIKIHISLFALPHHARQLVTDKSGNFAPPSPTIVNYLLDNSFIQIVNRDEYRWVTESFFFCFISPLQSFGVRCF